jgi:hypothetical protein
MQNPTAENIEIIEWHKPSEALPAREEDHLLDMHGDLVIGWLSHNGNWRDSDNHGIPEPYAWASPKGLYRKDNP